MSPERVGLEREPIGVRVLPGTAQAALAEIAQRRIDAAFERGRRAELERVAGGLERAAVELEHSLELARGEIGRSALALALSIAKTLLRAEVDAGRYDLERLVREALEQSGAGRARCAVHVHPNDAQRLASVRFRAGTEIVPDASVAQGDVRVRTEDGWLVRELDRAVATIGERIREELA